MQAMTLAVPPQTRHVSTSILKTRFSRLRPGHGHMTLSGRFLLLASSALGLATLAPLRRCHQCSVFAIRGKYTVKTCQIDSGLGHQGGQFGNKVHRLEDDVGGAIPVRGFQLIPNLALIRQ